MKIGRCDGPAWLNGRARTRFNSYASPYTRASMSPLDLETAYGFAGAKRASSSTGSRSGTP